MSSDQQSALTNAEDFVAEVERLRAEVDRLETRIAQLDQLAHEDPLVALPNRRGLMRQLEKLIDRVRRYGDQAAVLFVDIDGLKTINDSLGHPAGDKALVQVSERLVHGVRASDCVARIGGDEFAILLEHVDEMAARETAARLVDGVSDCDFMHGGTVLPLSVAIGVAMILPSDRAEEVLARADAEMYRFKTGT
jgi:diguanylate cyclase (GGDEF)-like protein